jgi:3-oxoacyl-[acyl-carrier protein] reductase
VVVNISSIAGVKRRRQQRRVLRLEGRSEYDDVARARLAPAVRVVSISPGLVDTDFGRADPDWRQEQAMRTPSAAWHHPRM